MAFKDILSSGLNMISKGTEKGLDMISKGTENVKNAAIEKKNAMNEFSILKTRSTHIGPMKPYIINNPDPGLGKETQILNIGITISLENVRLLNNLLPIDETILDIKNTKEAVSEIEYVFAITDKRLWVYNKKEYMIYEFGTVENFEIINKGVLSQGVKFNNNAFVIDGTEADVTKFINTMMDHNFRDTVIKTRTDYLCGVTPIKQYTNAIETGITISTDGHIVLHNGDQNYLIKPSEITMVQLLINDSVVLTKGLKENNSIVSNPMEARKMSIKVTLNNMSEYTIETMKQNTMSTAYKREDSTYIDNYNFTKNVVDILAEMIGKTP